MISTKLYPASFSSGFDSLPSLGCPLSARYSDILLPIISLVLLLSRIFPKWIIYLAFQFLYFSYPGYSAFSIVCLISLSGLGSLSLPLLRVSIYFYRLFFSHLFPLWLSTFIFLSPLLFSFLFIWINNTNKWIRFCCRADVVEAVFWAFFLCLLAVLSYVALNFRHLWLSSSLLFLAILLPVFLAISRHRQLAKKRERRLLLPLSMWYHPLTRLNAEFLVNDPRWSILGH